MPLSAGVRMFDATELESNYGGGSITTVTPLTATTVAFGVNQSVMWINPAGTIATLTVLLPPSPVAGQKAEMSFSQIVTALTVQTATGGAVQSTAGVAAAALIYRFVGAAWVAWD
jgi:ABC-type sulfate transport system permease component